MSTTIWNAGLNSIYPNALTGLGWYSVLSYGAVADCDFDGSRQGDSGVEATDNSDAFQEAINAAWLATITAGSEDYGGTVYIPPGHYLVKKPVYVWPSIRVLGGGMYSTKVFAPASFTGRGVFVTDATDPPYSNVPGFPTTIDHLSVLSVTGGAYEGTGIYLNKNGSFLNYVWVAGFQNGIVLNNTDCFVTNFASEINDYGIVCLQPQCNVSSGVLHQNGYGVFVQNIITATALGGTSTTIQFPAVTTTPSGAEFTQTDDAFNTWAVTIRAGTGAGQTRVISDYNGSTRTATVGTAWSTPPDSTSVFDVEFDNGSIILSDLRIQPSDQVGIYLNKARRVQINNCNVMQAKPGKFAQGGVRIEDSVDVQVNNIACKGGLNKLLANTSVDGIAVVNSAFVNITGGLTAFWRDGVSVTGGQNVTISNMQSTSNTRKGALLDGGLQHQINGGQYSGNDSLGVESVNSATEGVHTIKNIDADGLNSTQAYGIKAALSGNGLTHITGNTARNNVTSDISTTDSAGNNRLTVDNNVPGGGAGTIPTVASANTLTLPASVISGGVVKISGSTTINSITATGFAGARVTLIAINSPNIADGGNLRLSSNYGLGANYTITLVCDGTYWFEVARAAT